MLVKKLRKFHKWPGIIISAFVILFAVSGIIMNHRGTVSSLSVSRSILPSYYTYNNWNMSAVRGSVNLSNNTSLIYGNIGVWKTPDDFKTFENYNQGFPKGIDNRKINSLVIFPETNLVAGTFLGLYKRDYNQGDWQEVQIPVDKKRIVDLIVKQDTLLVLTRHYLLKTTDLKNFQKIQLPPPVNYQRKAGLFNTLWELHSGELFGIIGKLVVDLFGLVVIILSVTGLLHFLFPKIIRKQKKAGKHVSQLIKTKRKNLKWHNVIGYVFVLFLVINTISGMHLRPPLLIAIANKQVGILPYTHMDSPNPWFDKLRRITWDESLHKYIISTSDGFFMANENLDQELIPCPIQPPVSVMGCNILESGADNTYLVGSFSGLYIWDIKNNGVYDFFSQQEYQKPEGMSRPIGANMAAGLITKKNGQTVWFDYDRGALSINSGNNSISNIFPKIPDEIVKESPMSLWNVALEIHTGRIFEHLVGPFYILYVPLAGICILIVLTSGFFIWWLAYRKNKK